MQRSFGAHRRCGQGVEAQHRFAECVVGGGVRTAVSETFTNVFIIFTNNYDMPSRILWHGFGASDPQTRTVHLRGSSLAACGCGQLPKHPHLRSISKHMPFPPHLVYGHKASYCTVVIVELPPVGLLAHCGIAACVVTVPLVPAAFDVVEVQPDRHADVFTRRWH